MSKNICELLESYEDFIHHNPVTIEEIRAAEEQLNLKFADDFVECLLNYGCVLIEDMELLGITSNENRSVVHYTTMNKELEDGDRIPDDMYAIEDLHIDCLTAWQDQSGAVYLTLPFQEPQKVADSLAEYIEKSLNDEI